MVEPKHRRRSVANRPKKKSTKCSHCKYIVDSGGGLVCRGCGKPPPESGKERALRMQKKASKAKAKIGRKRPVNKKSNQGGSIRNG